MDIETVIWVLCLSDLAINLIGLVLIPIRNRREVVNMVNGKRKESGMYLGHLREMIDNAVTSQINAQINDIPNKIKEIKLSEKDMNIILENVGAGILNWAKGIKGGSVKTDKALQRRLLEDVLNNDVTGAMLVNLPQTRDWLLKNPQQTVTFLNNFFPNILKGGLENGTTHEVSQM